MLLDNFVVIISCFESLLQSIALCFPDCIALHYYMLPLVSLKAHVSSHVKIAIVLCTSKSPLLFFPLRGIALT